ncbi:MAG: hypothetical protein LAO06_11790 [Acidobacteriia bacterium]|nr:hypothetical protein [Terriglobia bacterium]
MNCSECTALDRTLKAALAQYVEARSAAYYRVSTEFAAIKQVDMERAKASVQEHELVCRFAAQVGPATDIAGQRLGKQSLDEDDAR